MRNIMKEQVKPMNKDFFEIDVMKDMGECANIKLPDPTLLDYYKRLKRREILINQEIDDGIIEWTQEIIEWNREDRDIEDVSQMTPVKIFINSNGGSLNAIMELITICSMSGYGGDTGKVIDDLEQTKKNEEKVKEFILSRTKISEDLYDKNYRKNWWLDSSEIIKYGLADHVIENIEELF